MSQTVAPVSGTTQHLPRPPSIGDLIDAGATTDAGFKSDAYDALQELFLGDGSAARRGAPGTPATARAVRIEGLILGHLPVLASAWATQYARNLAATLNAPVALLRLRAGEGSVDVFGGPGAERMADGAGETLEDAVRSAAGTARVWLVRVDETSEPRLTDLAGMDAVTLLTGADEAAVVASYRTIKQLFRPGDQETSGPEVRLAIMGAPAQRAADATSKLERAAEAFLGRKVAVTACIAKIGGSRTATLFRGPISGTSEELLARLLPVIRATPASGGRAAANPVVAKASMPVVAIPAPTPRVSAPAPAPVEQPAPAVAMSRLGHGAVSTSGAGPLAGHLRGLTALQAACPFATGVELAADGSGGLHLLARAAEGQDPSQALAALVAAAAWAKMHATLLRLAAAADSARLEEPERATLHLFTADARSARRLLDAEVRLHLLARVEVAGQAGWFCTELN